MDWILNTESGRDFLHKLYFNENLGVYKMKTMKMIIVFLYYKLKSKIIYFLLPFYILNLLSFLAQSFANEVYVKKLEIDQYGKRILKIKEAEPYLQLLEFFILTNLFFTVIQCGINYMIMKKMGPKYFLRLNCWVDIFIAVCCIVSQFQFNILIRTQTDDYHSFRRSMMLLRNCIVIGIILMFSKFAYFLSLFDEI